MDGGQPTYFDIETVSILREILEDLAHLFGLISEQI
jgi:hypothetical protein